MSEILDECDVKVLDKIITVTESINKIYEALKDLEVNNKKETKSYKDNIEYLKMATEYEEELYNSLNLTIYKCTDIHSYFIYEKGFESMLNTNESIMRRNFDNLILRRINNKILDMAVSLLNDDIELFSHDIDFLTESETLVYEGSSLFLLYLKKMINDDLYNGFLTYIKSYIEDDTYSIFKDNLIESVYYASFVTPSVESFLINNNFILEDKHVINSQECALKLFGTDILDFDVVRDKTLNPITYSQIISLSIFSNEMFSNKDIATEYILRRSMLKSSLSIYNRFERNKLKDIYIEDLKNISDDDYSASQNIILETLKESLTTDRAVRLKIRI